MKNLLVLLALGLYVSTFAQLDYFSVRKFNVAVGGYQQDVGGLIVRGRLVYSNPVTVSTVFGPYEKTVFKLDITVENGGPYDVIINSWDFTVCCPENNMGQQWQQNSYVKLVTPYVASPILLKPGEKKQFYTAETDFYWCLPKNQASLTNDPRYFTANISCRVDKSSQLVPTPPLPPYIPPSQSPPPVPPSPPVPTCSQAEPFDKELLDMISDYKLAYKNDQSDEMQQLKETILQIAQQAYPDCIKEIEALMDVSQERKYPKSCIPPNNPRLNAEGAGSAAATRAADGSEELLNVAVTGTDGEKKYVRFTLPPGVTFMEIYTTEIDLPGGTNACDLFVSKGVTPTTMPDPYQGYSADCASIHPNRQNDSCTFNNPQQGEWCVMLYDYHHRYHYSKVIVNIKR